jgi:hypothetical protein
MVGTSDYRKIPGPVVTAPTNLKQLQALIDKGEACFESTGSPVRNMTP